MTTLQKKIEKLAEVSASLWMNEVPACCWADEDKEAEFPQLHQTTNHWSGTRDAMEEFLGRKLDASEILILTLSRHYGPTPILEEDEYLKVATYLWPDGNPQGHRYDWDDLAKALEYFAKGKPNPLRKKKVEVIETSSQPSTKILRKKAVR